MRGRAVGRNGGGVAPRLFVRSGSAGLSTGPFAFAEGSGRDDNFPEWESHPSPRAAKDETPIVVGQSKPGDRLFYPVIHWGIVATKTIPSTLYLRNGAVGFPRTRVFLSRT